MVKNLKVLIKNSIVFSLVAALGFSGIVPGWAELSSAIGSASAQSRPLIPALPHDLGKVTDVFIPQNSSAKPLLIHIEDAHAHFETQQKIREILKFLKENRNLEQVFLEGASGRLDQNLFKIFPDQSLNINAAEYWMKEGRFSGAEVFAIENMNEIKLAGAENRALYTKNLESFRRLHRQFKQIRPVLERWQNALIRLEKKVYLGDLKTWNDSRRKFLNGEIDLLNYARLLERLSGEGLNSQRALGRLFDIESSLKSISEDAWKKEYRTISGLIRTPVLKKNWKSLKGSIHEINLTRLEKDNLLIARNPRLFFEYLLTDLEKRGISARQFKELPKIARYLMLRGELDGAQVMEDLFTLEELTGKKLLQTRAERELYENEKAFQHLVNLFSLSIDRNQWTRILGHRADWNPSSLGEKIGQTAGEIPDESFRLALEFYETAYKREEALVRNAVEQFEKSNEPLAVLITGGFHSDGIRRLLRKRGVNYLSVRPEVLASGEESKYLEVMLGEKKILPGAYFSEPNLSQSTLATSSPFDPAEKPVLARMIVKTLLNSGRAISSSEAFRRDPSAFLARLEGNLAEISSASVFEDFFGVNPDSIKVSGGVRPEDFSSIRILLSAREDGALNIEVPLVDGRFPSLRLTSDASSLGSSRLRVTKYGHFDVSNIGFWGFRSDVAKTTATVLAGRQIDGKPVQVVIYDFERNIKATEENNHEAERQTLYDRLKKDGLIKLHGMQDVAEAEALAENIKKWQKIALREHSIILLDPGAYPNDGNIGFYENYITERAKGFAKALKELREESGDTRPRIFAIRNQLRPGLTEEVMRIILKDSDYDTDFAVVHLPDLFRGGQQMSDMENQKLIFGFPDLKRVVTKQITIKKPDAQKKLRKTARNAELALRSLLIHPRYGPEHLLRLNARSAELTPFSTQLYLFTKLLTFMTFTQLVHALGGDMEKVSVGAGLDYRIGLHFTKTAFGIGGRARKFIETSMSRISPKLRAWLDTLRDANSAQIKWFQKKIVEDTLSSRFGIHDIAGQEIAVLGLAYKAKNGSMLNSPAMDLIRWLIEKKAGKILISDPYVSEKEFRAEIDKMYESETDPVKKAGLQRAKSLDIFEFKRNPLDAIRESSAVIIATDHPEFKDLTPDQIAGVTRGEYGNEEIPVFDGRNIYSPVAMGKAGVNYISIGRQPVGPKFGPTKDWDAIENVEFDRNRTGMNIAMIGGVGYVALATGAEMSKDHYVTSLEIRTDKVEKINAELERAVKQKLTRGIDIGIHEPGLDEVIIRNYKDGRLKYVPSYDDKNLDRFVEGDPAAEAIAKADVVYIGVGTPEGANGEADLSYLLGATRGIGYVLKNIVAARTEKTEYPRRKVIVVKSTVPPGAFEKMKEVLENEFGLAKEIDFDLASNPEVLREGQAESDVSKPVRTILGVESLFAAKVLRELWHPLEKRWPHKVLITDTVTAPLIKYLSNVFLAISISYVNALSWYAQDEGASITQIVKAMKSDHRISTQPLRVLMNILEPAHREKFTEFLADKKVNPGDSDHLPQGWEGWPEEIKQYCKISSFLGPGIGWGGSCFPKDLKAAKRLFEGVLKRQFGIIDATIEINDYAPEKIYQDIVKFLDVGSSGRMDVPLRGKKIAMLGQAFKKDTDDVRETRSLPFLLMLLDGGAQVTVHDPLPAANLKFKLLLAETILYSESYAPLLEKVRAHPYVAELKEHLQKKNLKLTENSKEIDVLFQKVYGTTLFFEPNPAYRGDKKMSKKEMKDELNQELDVIGKASMDSDLVVIVTDWDVFRMIDLDNFYKKMRRKEKGTAAGPEKKLPIIFDARNLLDPESPAARKIVLLQVGETPQSPINLKPSSDAPNGKPRPDDPIAKVEGKGSILDQGSGATEAKSLGIAASPEAIETVNRWMNASSRLQPQAGVSGRIEKTNNRIAALLERETKKKEAIVDNILDLNNASIALDARATALRIHSGGSAKLPGRLAFNAGSLAGENLKQVLELAALSLRSPGNKSITIVHHGRKVQDEAKQILENLRVDYGMIAKIHWISSKRNDWKKNLETHLMGATAVLGEGRVIYVDATQSLASVQIPGVRKISTDEIVSAGGTHAVKSEDRLVAQIAAIDLGLDLLSSTVANPHPDKLNARGEILHMKESFLSEFMARWITELHAEMQVLISA